MHVFDVVSKYIYAEHGWAVAGQFDDTCSDTSTFEEQNSNALWRIRDTVKEFVFQGPFDEDSTDELKEYYDELCEYLNEYKTENA